MGQKKKTNIKYLFTALCAIMVLMSTILESGGMTVQAKNVSSSQSKKIKKLVAQMNNYEEKELFEKMYSNQNGKNVTVKLTRQNMAEASALSIPKKNLKRTSEKGEFGDYVTWKLTDAKLKEASRNLFGQKATTANLRKLKKSLDADYFDAYRTAKGTPVVYYTDGDVELDHDIIKVSVSKTGNNTYKVVRKVYYGYWGGNQGKPNYKVIYQVKKDRKSTYGYVITGMSMKVI